jgi:hypothetical protein
VHEAAPVYANCSNFEFRETQPFETLVKQLKIVTYSLLQDAQIHEPKIGHSIESCASLKNGD